MDLLRNSRECLIFFFSEKREDAENLEIECLSKHYFCLFANIILKNFKVCKMANFLRTEKYISSWFIMVK